MFVPDNIRKCVVFIGYKTNTGNMKLAGTAFLGLREIDEDGTKFAYLITAKHVMDRIRERLCHSAFLRVNCKDGSAQWVESDLSHWYYHPDDALVDVAIAHYHNPGDLDHLVFPLSHSINDERLSKYSIGLGDEVIVVGLFSQHHGTQKNIPIVRVGNIAAMPEEKIFADKWGAIDAYLIEARSLGGLSGSPVFVNLGSSRLIDGKVCPLETSSQYLLGLVHGHWNLGQADRDSISEDWNREEPINLGIAIVIPASKIWEVISQPVIRNAENQIAAGLGVRPI